MSWLFGSLDKLVVDAVNHLIAGLAAAITAVLSVLPDMPALPQPPEQLAMAAAWVGWFWPVGTTIDVLTFLSSMYVLWWGFSILLRWARALND